MRLRALGLAVTLAVGLPPIAGVAEAQQAKKVWRIGFLSAQEFRQPFEQGLRDLGYVDGHNVTIEYRSDSEELENLAGLTAELVSLKVDVLVVGTTQRALAAKNATTTIPIVMVNVGGPVENGLVASLARPGGNITGLSRATPDLIGKNLQLLAEAVPGVVRVAIPSNPTNPLHPTLVRHAKEAAKALRLHLRIVEAGAPNELNGAFSAMIRERVGALLVLADGMFYGRRIEIADLALRKRLPSMFGNKEHAEVGGLMSYAANSIAPYRQAGAFVDKILRGAKPGDLPVEQPTKFELVVNLKTAKALGLRLPQLLLLRTDHVIQ